MNRMRAWKLVASVATPEVKISGDALPIMVWRTTEATRKIMLDGYKWETKGGRGMKYETKKIIVKTLLRDVRYH